MHLIFLHGRPGVGKRTVAQELSNALGFPFLNTHHLGALLSPVFGGASELFHNLRTDIFNQLVNEALGLPESGLIVSFTYDPTVSLEGLKHYIARSRESGGTALFLQLTCDESDLQIRAENTDLGSTQDGLGELAMPNIEHFEVPDMPGPSITINTSGESAEETVENILMMLPNDIRKHQLDLM